MKKFLFTFVALLLPSMASADYVQKYESGGFIGGADAKIDGICYKFNSADQTASVTYQKIGYDDSRGWPVNDYSGDVVIPETVKYNGVIYKVTSIGMGAFDNTHDATYGYSLIERPSSWTPVTSITIPSSVTTIGDGAFRWCTSLNSINIPNSVKTIGEYAFSGCEGLTSINIPNTVTSIGESAFYYCTNLTSITIPTNVSSIGAGVFACCYILKSIIIPENVTSIGNYAFDYCKELTSITIPDNVTSIGDGAFRGCSGLSTILIPDNVTSIGDGAFSDCSNLASVTLGYYLTQIGDKVFHNCSSLSNVYCYAQVPPSYDNEKRPFDWEMAKTSIYLYVPASSINDYKEYMKQGTGNSYVGWGYILWSNILPLASTGGGKVATPTIGIANGVLKFECATDGAEYRYSITYPESNSNTEGNNVQLPQITVSVYAIKAGYEKSDTATKQFTLASGLRGDLDGNGVVNVIDHVELSNIILEQDK